MATYNIMDYIGNDLARGIRGRDYGDPSGASGIYTNCIFLIDCEGANNYTYVNNTAPPGTKDVAITDTNFIALTGTWQLKTAQFNLGTSSLLLPQTNSYIRTSIGKSSNVAAGTIGAWIYLTSNPSAEFSIFGLNTATGGIDGVGTNKAVLSITSAGKLKFSHQLNSVTNTVTPTSTASVPTGAWSYISCTWKGDRVWFGIGGTIEELSMDHIPFVANATLYGYVASTTNVAASTYVDDFFILETFHPPFTNNYSVPTQQIQGVSSSVDRTLIALASLKAFRRAAAIGNEEIVLLAEANLPYKGEINLLTEFVYQAASNAGLKHLFGMTSTGANGIVPGTGAGGAARPTTGMLYPRGTLC